MKTLAAYISDQGLTQAEFAKKAEMTQGNVSKLCGNSPKISKEVALDIERLTGGDVPIEVWPQFNFIASLRHDLKRGDTGAIHQGALSESGTP